MARRRGENKHTTAARRGSGDGGLAGDSLPFSSSLSRSHTLTSLGFSMPSLPSFKSRTTTAAPPLVLAATPVYRLCCELACLLASQRASNSLRAAASASPRFPPGATAALASVMAPHYQATTLIASPSYPNAITWSSENLVAVASAHIVTILNPADHDGPRGLVVLHPSNPFPIGVVSKEDLFEPCLVPTGLARDTVMLNQVHDQFHGLNNDLLIILVNAYWKVDDRWKAERSCEM